MKPRFEPDPLNDASAGANQAFSPTLIDPEAYDASEQTFAASLEPAVSNKSLKFVVEPEVSEALTGSSNRDSLPDAVATGSSEARDEGMAAQPEEPVDSSDPESWRREVAARLSHYRARRRTREPRYPSLQLKFETEPVRNAAFVSSEPLTSTPVVQDRVESPSPSAAPRIRLAEPVDHPRLSFAPSNEATAKVIEFSSYSAAPRLLDELAEPVLDRPRIIEAPELVPPPPALGGISIEPAEEPENERRPGFEIPLRAAPMGRRMAAAAVDAFLVIAAIAAFVYIFFRITAEVPSPAKVAGTAVVLIGAMWSAYQYLLLVYSGATPGLRLARLELQMFDGDPVPRRLRRWRVLASVLSGVSLGLGYAWCLLDEDELCWHDRITRTYMAPKRQA
ncbi:MAG: RDD family protein [Terriglobales bacterium]